MTFSESALEFATVAHKGQTRWDRKVPYITHPIGVAEIARKILAENQYSWNNIPAHDHYHEAIIAACYLHDVAEDCPQWKDREEYIVTEVFNRSDMAKHSGAPFILRDCLRILNKHRHDGYLEFVLAARSFIPARIVKIADISHNLSDLTKKGSMLDKYRLALYLLEHDNF